MPTPEYYEGKATIRKQEWVVSLLMDRGISGARAFDAATALKYVERAGEKSGETMERDLGKAADYLFRAIAGAWPWEADGAGEVV